MKVGTKVAWLLPGKSVRGGGVTLSEPDASGGVVVAVDNFAMETPLPYKPVIYCQEKWLVDVEAEKAKLNEAQAKAQSEAKAAEKARIDAANQARVQALEAELAKAKSALKPAEEKAPAPEKAPPAKPKAEKPEEK